MMTPSKDCKIAHLICVLGIFLLAPGVSHARTIVGLTVGDSITQGLVRDFFGNVGGVTSPQSGSKNFGGYQPPAVSQFNADNADTLELYNWGVAGALSVEGIDRTRTALASRDADVVFIEYGANDAYAFIGGATTVFNIFDFFQRL